MKRRCVVNLVTEERRYVLGQERLIRSMSVCNIPLIVFRGVESVGAPSHQKTPFAFKLHAIEEVRRMGFEQVLWVDSSVYAVGEVELVFDRIDKNGFFFEDSGHMCGRWLREE
jgi:hypothetical protein